MHIVKTENSFDSSYIWALSKLMCCWCSTAHDDDVWSGGLSRSITRHCQSMRHGVSWAEHSRTIAVCRVLDQATAWPNFQPPRAVAKSLWHVSRGIYCVTCFSTPWIDCLVEKLFLIKLKSRVTLLSCICRVALPSWERTWRRSCPQWTPTWHSVCWKCSRASLRRL